LTNTTRRFRALPLLEIEDARSVLLAKLLDTLKNIEQEFPLLVPSGNDAKARTTQNFYQKQKIDLNYNISQFHHGTPYTGINQLQIISTIEKNQLLYNVPPTQ